jgi:hypothetical protein
MTQARLAWTVGKEICVDESMIKYMGRAITWVQYLPRKPIKHGIKVFALCCGQTGVLIGHLVYTGRKEQNDAGGQDWSALGVIETLLVMASLLDKGKGRVLYTDNWYTSIALMCTMYFKYGFLLVGTISLTTKLSRTAADYPFRKLSNGALSLVPRGWRRRATRFFTGTTTLGKAASFIGQATIWKDKKLVGLLHNHKVEGFTGDTPVWRWSTKERKKIRLDGVPAGISYSKHYNGVDRLDRANADWTVSVRTNRFYLRIFFWQFDATIHLMYIIVIHSLDEELVKKYKDHRDGRQRFQIDLALALAEFALRYEWDGEISKSNLAGRPKWMRGTDIVPCDCGVCFFCKNGFTTGIAHKPVGAGPPSRAKKPKGCSVVREKVKDQTQTCKVCYKIAKTNYSGDLKGKPLYLHLSSMCHHDTLGCANCGMVVCEKHYYSNTKDSFTHNPSDYQ